MVRDVVICEGCGQWGVWSVVKGVVICGVCGQLWGV